MKKFLPLIILFAILVPSFVFTIDEREQAIITEFGEFKRSVIKPGIHFKKPFIEKISRFEKRMLRINYFIFLKYLWDFSKIPLLTQKRCKPMCGANLINNYHQVSSKYTFIVYSSSIDILCPFFSKYHFSSISCVHFIFNSNNFFYAFS